MTAVTEGEYCTGRENTVPCNICLPHLFLPTPSLCNMWAQLTGLSVKSEKSSTSSICFCSAAPVKKAGRNSSVPSILSRSERYRSMLWPHENSTVTLTWLWINWSYNSIPFKKKSTTSSALLYCHACFSLWVIMPCCSRSAQPQAAPIWLWAGCVIERVSMHQHRTHKARAGGRQLLASLRNTQQCSSESLEQLLKGALIDCMLELNEHECSLQSEQRMPLALHPERNRLFWSWTSPARDWLGNRASPAAKTPDRAGRMSAPE